MKEIVLNFREEIYTGRMASFIRRYYGQELRIAGCYSGKEVQKKESQLLLTDDWEVFKQFPGESYFFDFSNQGEGIDPYQSMEGILGELFWVQKGEKTHCRRSDSRLIVFYTPGGSSTQRRAALQKCREAAPGNRCLYIPVRDMEFRREEYPVMYDLSELCYCLKKDGRIYLEQLQAAVEKRENYDAMRGFHSPIHPTELGNEIGVLLDWIDKNTEYETVVLDLQILPPDYQTILGAAEEIYLVEDTETTEEQLKLYALMELLLKQSGREKNGYQVWRWGEKYGREVTLE